MSRNKEHRGAAFGGAPNGAAAFGGRPIGSVFFVSAHLSFHIMARVISIHDLLRFRPRKHPNRHFEMKCHPW